MHMYLHFNLGTPLTSDKVMVMVPVLPEGLIGKLLFVTMFLFAKQFMYTFWFVSTGCWFQWQHCDKWYVVCTGARFEWAKRKFQTPNNLDIQPMNYIISRLLPSREKVKTKLKTSCPNKIQVDNVVLGIYGTVNAQCKLVWITIVVLHSSMHSPASLSAHLWATCSQFWKILRVHYGS
jgi:hypothetical protein